MNETTPNVQPSPRKGKAWLITIPSICLVLLAAYLVISKTSTTINYQEQSKAPIGLMVVKTEPFKALSTMYAQGLGRRTGQALHEFKSIFLLKNLATLRFGLQYNHMTGVEKLMARSGNKTYIIVRKRQRPTEGAPPIYEVSERKKNGSESSVTGAEAEKLIQHYLPIAEKKLEAARQMFASEIKEAEELRMQWEKEHPRPPRKKEGPPPDRKNPDVKRGQGQEPVR